VTPFAKRGARDEQRLDPERVAYWYFRLNGFLQIENFVVHPGRKGGQRTDADILAVRFPYRAEFLLDHHEPMQDDIDTLALSADQIDIVIAEVKTNQPCILNGPWTIEDRQNVPRVLAAIGCLPRERIDTAAKDIYGEGLHASDGLRIRLVAIGRDHNIELAASHPRVVQLTWSQILHFIWNRFDKYRQQKTQVDQWDRSGKHLKRLAENCKDAAAFEDKAYASIGLQHNE